MSRCDNLTVLGAIFIRYVNACLFGGQACVGTWLQTVLGFFFLLPNGLCIDVNFILAYVTTGSYVSGVLTHYTFATVYKGRHCH